MNRSKVQVPVALLQLAFEKRFLKHFKTLVAAKIATSGHFVVNSNDYMTACRLSGLQKQSFDKHLQWLYKNDWIGFDPRTKRYFIRSWEYYRFHEWFKARSSVLCGPNEMKNFTVFAFGSVLGAEINKHRFYWKSKINNTKLFKILLSRQVKGRLIRPVVSKSHTTEQGTSAPSTAFPDYFGLSNELIAKLFNCSYTQACKLKHLAEKAGYIKTNPKYFVRQQFSEPNYDIRYYYGRGLDEHESCKLRILSEIDVNGAKTYFLVEQLFDELIPCLRYKRVPYYAHLKAKLLLNGYKRV